MQRRKSKVLKTLVCVSDNMFFEVLCSNDEVPHEFMLAQTALHLGQSLLLSVLEIAEISRMYY